MRSIFEVSALPACLTACVNQSDEEFVCLFENKLIQVSASIARSMYQSLETDNTYLTHSDCN